MEALGQLIRLIHDGGSLGWAVVSVGAFALLMALFVLFGSLLRAPSNVVRFLSMTGLVMSLVTSGLGLACTLLGRQDLERAVKGERPSRAERLTHQGFVAARSGVALAVPLAAPPILLGVLGLLIAARRRQSEDHDRAPPGIALALALLALDSAAVGGSVLLYLQPVPGRDLDEDNWRVRELTDALDAADWDECLTTTWQLKAGSEAQKLAAHAENQKRCVEHFTGADARLDDVEKLDATKWVDQPALVKTVTDRLAELKASKPAEPGPDAGTAVAAVPEAQAPVAAATSVAFLNTDVAEVQAKARACFDKAAKKKKHLTVATALAVEVSAAGKVVAVKDTGSGKLDAVRKCAVSSAKGLKLKPGAARKFQVPIAFP